MGKASKVPPLPRRAPQAADGLTALAESSPDSGHEGDDVPTGQRAGQQAPFEAPASLPRRVRGAGDRPRPPAQVARPVLPESFLERVRAAAEAARRQEEQAPSDTDAGFMTATTGSAFVPPSREAPAAEVPAAEVPAAEAPAAEAPAAEAPAPEPSSAMPSTALPQRVRGGNDGPRPPARVARPALSAAFLERVRAAIQADADAQAEDDSHDGAPIPLPRRDLGGAGGPRPAGMVQPAPAAGPGTSPPGDATTEPIPVITVPPGTTTDAQVADVAGAAPENATLARPGTAGAPATPEAGTAAPGPEAVKALPKLKAAKRAPKPKAVTAPPQPKAVKAPPKPPPMHRVPRTGPGTEKPPKRQERASRGYRMAGVLVTTVTVGLLAVGFAVFHHGGGNTARDSGASRGSSGRSSTGSARPVDSATLGRNAAAWVAAQVGQAVISCDPAMCQALKARGIPAHHLYVLKPGMTNPLDSAVIVATPILRSQIGSRLTSVYAPGLLADFGSGNRQIQVRTIALHGPADYMSQVRADLAARKMSGTALAGNSRIVTSAAARKELAAGDVDSRLMTVITGLAASHPVDIVSFGESGPDMATAPFRSAELAESNMAKMVATVSGQQPPFRVAHMASVRLGTGQPVLRIDFSAPSLFGLLGSGDGN